VTEYGQTLLVFRYKMLGITFIHHCIIHNLLHKQPPFFYISNCHAYKQKMHVQDTGWFSAHHSYYDKPPYLS